MATERPPLNRDIRNLINDGKIFRQEIPSMHSDEPSGEHHLEISDQDTSDRSRRRNLGALGLKVDGFRQLISLGRPENEQT